MTKKVRLKIDIEINCSDDFAKRLKSDELHQIVLSHCFRNNARTIIQADVHKTFQCVTCGSTQIHWDETHDNSGFSEKIDHYEIDEAWCQKCDSEQKVKEYTKNHIWKVA